MPPTDSQPQSLDMKTILDNVEERAEKKKQEIFKGVDDRNAALDARFAELTKLQTTIAQAMRPTPAMPDGQTGPATLAQEPSKDSASKRFLGTLGLKTRVSVPVSIDKQTALNMLATGETSLEMESIIDAGARALALSAAFDAKIVTGPRKGLTAWQTAGLALAGTAAVGAGVTVGVMYVTDTGLFRPKAPGLFEPEPE